MEHTDQS